MSDPCTLLDRLIVASEAALTLRSPGEIDFRLQLIDDVAAWHAKPAPDGRVVHAYTVLLASALIEAAAAIATRGASEAQPYFRIIGVILPDVRADFARAIEMRRRPTP